MSVIKWSGGILIGVFIVFLLLPQERVEGSISDFHGPRQR